MPDWWHELSFDLLCIINSLAAAAALIGVHSLRMQLDAIKGKIRGIAQSPAID